MFAVIETKQSALKCINLDDGKIVTVRAKGTWGILPGMVFDLNVTKSWVYGKHTYMSGTIENPRIEVSALKLTPLRLTSHGLWDPCDEREWWREKKNEPEPWERDIILAGPRNVFEMEQVLPGQDPTNIDSDPISEAVDNMEYGNIAEAYAILSRELAADLRCIDAHVHLGNLEFDGTTSYSWKRALIHYQIGVQIGELSLGPNFNGLLPWSLTDNRPMLRCLIGLALTLWRFQRNAEAEKLFVRLLWLNPFDNQGVRFNLHAIRSGLTWDSASEAIADNEPLPFGNFSPGHN